MNIVAGRQPVYTARMKRADDGAAEAKYKKAKPKEEAAKKPPARKAEKTAAPQKAV